VSFAAGLREPIVTLYGGQSNDCSPTRYIIGCGNRHQSNIVRTLKVLSLFKIVLRERRNKVPVKKCIIKYKFRNGENEK